ncbi:unnamed protein product [Darwinula stevensoni]|uniref:Uncharacterized protein n=1 Tax=Darwinula stevensoni TaxID=69355 RepID=A0A7R8XHH8_9CRUS|nr:unnamed protein product [Darwinula stevensoni]CAG0893523.1 unnamed protein product [Darwinula stevensoni]
MPATEAGSSENQPNPSQQAEDEKFQQDRAQFDEVLNLILGSSSYVMGMMHANMEKARKHGKTISELHGRAERGREMWRLWIGEVNVNGGNAMIEMQEIGGDGANVDERENEASNVEGGHCDHRLWESVFKYLEEIKDARKRGLDLVFIDETWHDTRHDTHTHALLAHGLDLGDHHVHGHDHGGQRMQQHRRRRCHHHAVLPHVEASSWPLVSTRLVKVQMDRGESRWLGDMHGLDLVATCMMTLDSPRSKFA